LLPAVVLPISEKPVPGIEMPPAPSTRREVAVPVPLRFPAERARKLFAKLVPVGTVIVHAFVDVITLLDDVGVKPVGERVGEVDHLAESLHWNDPPVQ
jgi:hypothetical protein